MLKRMLLTLILMLFFTGQAWAEWRVDYLVRGSVNTPIYSQGSYMFLKLPGYVPTYLLNVNWRYIGMELSGTTPQFQQYGVAVLPAGFPQIAFPGGIDMIIVTPLVQINP